MTGFDILVLIVVGVSALLAFARGFIREVLSMAALVVAILAVLWGLPVFRAPVRELIEPGWIADTITVVSIFLLIYIAIRVLTGRIHEWVHDSEPLGIIDRSAGILFGVGRGFVLMAIFVLAITSVAKKDLLPKFLTTSSFYPFLAITANVLQNFAPDATRTAGDIAKGASEAGEDVVEWRGNAVANTIDTEAEPAQSSSSSEKTSEEKRQSKNLKIESGK